MGLTGKSCDLKIEAIHPVIGITGQSIKNTHAGTPHVSVNILPITTSKESYSCCFELSVFICVYLWLTLLLHRYAVGFDRQVVNDVVENHVGGDAFGLAFEVQ